jgi:hypothetical protein
MPQPGLIERGKVSGEKEYKHLYVQIGYQKFTTESGGESFWGIRLNDEYFVFCNNLLEFFGHHIIGRVGVHSNNVMLREKTVEYFLKIDSQEA